MNLSKKTRKVLDGLTWLLLIGLLAFILILLIPTSIDYPSISGPKAEEQNHLGQIAKSFILYEVYGQPSPRLFVSQPGDTVHNAAFILARDVQLNDASVCNDASVWFVKSDEKLMGAILPQTVMLGDAANGTINPDFAKLPLSVVVVTNISTNVSPTTTPVVWTRGLSSDGTWAPDSPWKGKGGHIAYADGHVEWCDKFLSVKWGTTIPTTNIREALPPGAVILSAEPRHPAK